MKLWFVSIISVVYLTNCAKAQYDSLYRYVYTFRLDTIVSSGKLAIDSFPNKKDSPTIKIRFSNRFDKLSEQPIICLTPVRSNLRCVTISKGKLDTLINAGSYILDVNVPNYLPVQIKFSAAPDKNLRFLFTLEKVPSLQVYQIDSKKELTTGEIEKIKRCIRRKHDMGACSENNAYFVTMQI